MNLNYELFLKNGEVMRCKYEDETTRVFIIRNEEYKRVRVNKSDCLKMIRHHDGETYTWYEAAE